MFGGELRAPVGVEQTSWYFKLDNREIVLKVGSIIQMFNGDMYEVAYCTDYNVVTTQNKTFDILLVSSVVENEFLDTVEEEIGRLLEESKNMDDAVNHPSHYTKGKFEVIEVIEEWTKHYDDGYVAYCVGNSMKYEARAPHKHDSPVEDLKKARTYLDFAIRYLEETEGEK